MCTAFAWSWAARVRMEQVVRDFLRRFYKEVWDDDLLGLASQCAYSFLFAMFPFLIFLVSLAAYLPFTADGSLPPELLGQMPGPVREIVDNRVTEVASGDRGGLLTFALVIALWSATTGATTLVTAINRAYDVAEKRSFLRRRLIGFFLVLAGAVLVLLPTMWGWFGGIASRFLERYGMFDAAVVVDWLRWPVILAGAFAWLALLFRVAPEGNAKWRLASPGAFVAALGFLASNRALSFYLENATDMSVTYGTLGGFVALVLWLYVCSLVLLLGAEVNALLDPERKRVTPPPRETAPSDRRPLATRRPVRT